MLKTCFAALPRLFRSETNCTATWGTHSTFWKAEWLCPPRPRHPKPAYHPIKMSQGSQTYQRLVFDACNFTDHKRKKMQKRPINRRKVLIVVASDSGILHTRCKGQCPAETTVSKTKMGTQSSDDSQPCHSQVTPQCFINVW